MYLDARRTRHPTLYAQKFYVIPTFTLGQAEVEWVLGEVDLFRVFTWLVKFARSKWRAHVSNHARRDGYLGGPNGEADARHRIGAFA